ITDEGCGIEDTEQARRPSFTTGEFGERCGMGFLVMESFTDYLGVSSEMGKGTSVMMRKKLKP
ncbi:MAG: anti-sigma F factor, partial [Clostridia bacterium]|nr:anti-sigma F factor [Clostridia bacterium]